MRRFQILKSGRHHCLALIGAILCPSFLHAEDWTETIIDTGPEAGSRCAVTTDPAGQVHMAYVKNDTTLHYALQSGALIGLSKQEIGSGFTSSNSPAHVSIDVDSVGAVTVAYIGRDNKVGIFRKTSNALTWAQTIISNDGYDGSLSGVSVKNNFLVYTSLLENTSGPLKESRYSGSAWSTPASLTSGSGSGLAPQLAAVNVPANPLMLVYYDENTQQINTQTFVSSWDSWRSGESAISGIETFTRPSISIDQISPPASRTVGVAYKDDSQIKYSSRLFFGSSLAWDTSTVGPEDENEPLQSFGSYPVLFYDALSQPWVAYARLSTVFRPFPLRPITSTLDVTVKRFIQGIGWQRTTVRPLSNSGLTGQLAVAINGAGHPTLLFESEPSSGSDSSLLLLRPPNEPWVIGNVEDDFLGNHQFALGMTNNPVAGGIHLVADDATRAVLNPSFLHPARLITYRGNIHRAVDIPNSIPDRSTHGITVTPDGSIHIVGRITSTGALIYDRFIHDTVHQGTLSVTWSGATSGIAAEGRLSLDSDRVGNLYLAFPRPGGGIRISKLSAGATDWEDVAENPGGGKGIDLAVRPDGKIAISHYDDATQQVRAFTNIHPRTGAALATFEDRLAYQLTPAAEEPKNTAIVFLDATPRIAFANENSLVYLRRPLMSTSDFISFTIDSSLAESTVDLLTKGEKLEILAHTPQDEGRCTHLLFEDQFPSLLLKNERFAGNVGVLSSAVPEVAAVLDENDFPVMASVIYKAFPLGSTRNLLIMRPADALDYDGDGAPLIFENAFAMDPFVPDSYLLPTTEVGGNGSQTQFTFYYRYPVGYKLTTNGIEQVGEFLYETAISSDLKSFAGANSTFGGQLSFARQPLPLMETGARAQRVTLGISANFRANNPKLFGRLEVSRGKPDLFGPPR